MLCFKIKIRSKARLVFASRIYVILIKYSTIFLICLVNWFLTGLLSKTRWLLTLARQISWCNLYHQKKVPYVNKGKNRAQYNISFINFQHHFKNYNFLSLQTLFKQYILGHKHICNSLKHFASTRLNIAWLI